tara:strand:- start:1280 stop:2371 length:1092 start_codon:yes stop_codon:yes gene_type:complete
MRQQLADATSEFIGKRHSLTLRQTPKWAQSLILILLLFGGSALLASFIIKIDEVITVSGTLRPLNGTRDVLAPVTAELQKVNVQDGQSVRLGQVLVVYNTEDSLIRQANLKDQLSFAKKSLLQNMQLKSTEREALVRNLEFSEDIIKRYARLTEQGASSEISLLSQEKSLEDSKSQLIRLDQQTEQLRLQYNQRIRTIESELSQIQLLLQNSIVKSPIAGTIFELDAHPNQVATLGKNLMKIIPDDSAKAQVFVSNRDIGFVNIGQESQVRVDAYPFTKFGDLEGQVSTIGADVLEPDATNPSYRFPVTITLDSPVLRSQGRELPLKPGMSVQANLRLREKRLISIVTDMFARNVEGIKTLRN